MGDDFSAIASWASIFTEPKHLALTVGKHYWDERKAIKSDIASLKSDWQSGHFFRSGADLAALMTLAVGPIE